MLVISYGSFMETVQPLVDWKNRKGIPTEMVNVSDIGSNSTAIRVLWKIIIMRMDLHFCFW